MTKQTGNLNLFPNLLGDVKYHEVFLPQSVDKAVSKIDGLIAESEQGGRKFLKQFQTKKPPLEIPIALFHQKMNEEEIDFLLEPVLEGEEWGLVTDAGLPCIADPGSLVVRRAKKLGINVRAFVGPSSILLSLMLSGLPGQRFRFLGYLAKKPEMRREEIHSLEKESYDRGETQIFIEAPHRNRYLLEDLLSNLRKETLLSVAWDLTLPTQGIISETVEVWKKISLPSLDKKPTIFLVHSPKDKL